MLVRLLIADSSRLCPAPSPARALEIELSSVSSVESAPFAAVAVETLKIYESDRIVEHVQEVAPRFLARLQEMGQHPLVGEARLVGLMGSIALTPDKAKRAKFASETGTVGLRCRERCFANNLIMRACGDHIVSAPPLVISKAEVDQMIDTAARCMAEFERQLKEKGLA